MVSDETQALQSKHAVRQKALRLLSDEQAIADTIERTTQKKAQLEQLKAECAAELAPLDKEIAAFEARLQARREGATAKIRRMKDLQTSMRAMVEQLQSRDEMSARLTNELERIPKGQPRSAYTRRIMDIVKSLRKQKVDIEKILADIRESQLEVNATAETLSRSFAAADEVRGSNARAHCRTIRPPRHACCLSVARHRTVTDVAKGFAPLNCRSCIVMLSRTLRASCATRRSPSCMRHLACSASRCRRLGTPAMR